ncbi:MAG: hypothetical protein AAGJ46_20720 [Planctomycetota bacterium]
MIRLTLVEYLSIHPDFRDVWNTERTDWPDWPVVREQYVGKRTLMRRGELLVEGMHFVIAAKGGEQ